MKIVPVLVSFFALMPPRWLSTGLSTNRIRIFDPEDVKHHQKMITNAYESKWKQPAKIVGKGRYWKIWISILDRIFGHYLHILFEAILTIQPCDGVGKNVVCVCAVSIAFTLGDSLKHNTAVQKGTIMLKQSESKQCVGLPSTLKANYVE